MTFFSFAKYFTIDEIGWMEFCYARENNDNNDSHIQNYNKNVNNEGKKFVLLIRTHHVFQDDQNSTFEFGLIQSK